MGNLLECTRFQTGGWLQTGGKTRTDLGSTVMEGVKVSNEVIGKHVGELLACNQDIVLAQEPRVRVDVFRENLCSRLCMLLAEFVPVVG